MLPPNTPIALPPLRILLVDDQEATRQVLVAQLHAAGHAVEQADSAESALTLFRQHAPDLVLLDVEMPGHDGYWVASQLRASEAGGWTPIIFLSSLDQDHNLWQAIESGGDDYLVKPVSGTVLQAKLRAMQRLRRMQNRLIELSDELRVANEQLTRISHEDALTGLPNRRGFDLRLQQEILSAQRDQTPLTLVLCDIDFFKGYNDTLGHVEGDACLQQLGQLLRSLCRRPRDYPARYGGEEFALILPGTPRSGAMTFARALLRTLELKAIPHPCSSIAKHLTLSGGITTCVPDKTSSAEGLLRRADEALYAAKSRGRNCFFSFEMQMDTREQRGNGRLPPASLA
ncbi:diguanylate cyclase (GGDEF)-like protein [Paucibacter oligotrophus]|uniref:diguanylate cyclase n=1 Tax=Roseateles oligotrophus TaxID=1769250 RepID=A0A840LG74_9BURK|nr:diguanylate cyclase [Roseateles oligotrophus]MBB4845623.1 diguanylate cyclase (GGDEF)-like protein [Roseateles oligotrophus]